MQHKQLERVITVVANGVRDTGNKLQPDMVQPEITQPNHGKATFTLAKSKETLAEVFNSVVQKLAYAS